MSDTPSYGIVTPARDEVANLRRLVDSVLAQRAAPARWVIVDDASTDGTGELAAELASKHSWITSIPAPSKNVASLERGRLAGRDVVAFTAGVSSLQAPPEVVVKLDADVSFAEDFFERLIGAFAADPALGIAGGTCLELEHGEWQPVYITGDSVRGAIRAYRWKCLQDVLPLPECLGWDGLDAIHAKLKGWETRTLLDVRFFHHRRMGERDGSMRKGWESQGRAAHYMGYRPSYVLFRAMFHARRSPAALAMVTGYASAARAREPRHPDQTVVDALREQQRLRHLRDRLQEKIGRRRALAPRSERSPSRSQRAESPGARSRDQAG
jgi:biofilm PGA synthesis N-glycosyltransferase PgaC